LTTPAILRDPADLFRAPDYPVRRLDPRRPGVTIHYTAAARMAPAEAPRSHPARWETLYARTPAQVVRHLAEALTLTPARLGFGLSQLCEVAVFEAGKPGLPLAVITEGLSCADAEAAREALIRGGGR